MSEMKKRDSFSNEFRLEMLTDWWCESQSQKVQKSREKENTMATTHHRQSVNFLKDSGSQKAFQTMLNSFDFGTPDGCIVLFLLLANKYTS